jgi:hypothetical protein
MAIIITNQANTIKFDLGNGEEYHIDKDNLSVKKKFGFVYIHDNVENSRKFTKLKFKYSDVSSPVLASNTELVNLLLGYKVNTGVTVGTVIIGDDAGKIMTLEPNGSIPVTLQDQTTPLIVTNFSHLEQATTLSVSRSIGDYIIQPTSMTGIVIGKILTLFSPADVRFTQVVVTNVIGGDVYIDSPLDFAYPAGSFIDVQEPNLATLTGTQASPITCGIRNNAGQTPPPGLVLTFDVVRLIFMCYTTGNPTLSDFGDIENGLLNGLVLRKRDGEVYNIFNVKDNGDLAGYMFDFDVLTATGQGQPGFKARLTFGGQDKFGAVIRLPINEDLELLVQDDLSSLLRFEVIAEGSIVQ